MLERKFSEILLTGGLDVKEHSEAEGPSGFRRLEGFRFGELGKLERTPATSSVTVGYGNAHTLFKREDELAYMTDRRFSIGRYTGAAATAGSFEPSTVGSSTSTIFTAVPTEVYRSIVAQAQFGVDEEFIHAAAVADTPAGDIVVAWVAYTDGGYVVRMRAYSTDGVMVSTSDKYVSAQGSGSPSNAPHISACKNTTTGAIVTYSNSTGAPYIIKAAIYSDSSRSFGSTVTLTSAASSHIHKVKYNDYSSFYFAYLNNVGPYLTVETRTTGAVSATHTATHTATDFDVVKGSTDTIVGSISASNVITEILGTPGTTFIAATPGTGKVFTQITGSQMDSTDAAAFFVFGIDVNVSAQDFTQVVGVDFTGSMASDFPTFFEPNTAPVGGAFSIGKDVLCPMSIGRGTNYVSSAFSNTDAGVIIGRLSNNSKDRLDPVARCIHDRAYRYPLGGLTTSVVVSGDVAHVFAPGDPAADLVPSTNLNAPQSLFWARVTFPTTCLPRSYSEHETTSLLASGILLDYDGVSCCEAQPLRRPAMYIGTPGTAFSAVAIYTWVDRAGKLHRSAPSDSIMVDATDTVYVEVPPFTGRDVAAGQYSVEVYCTDGSGDATYYLANTSNRKDDYDSITTGGMHFTFSNMAIGSSANQALYTTGGVLESEPTPPAYDIATVGDRMFLIDAEDRRRWWTSKPFSAGFAPEWNTALTGFLGSEAEKVVDVQGVPTFFCSDGIYQLFGEGPNALGIGAFAPPRKISEIGCASRSSVADTPVGTFFQSQRGFVLFDGQAVQEIGLQIEPETNARTLTVKRVVYEESNNEIRVQCADVIYYYSIVNGAWSKLPLSTSEVDTAIVNGVVYRATTSKVLIELRRGDSGYNSRSGDSAWETPWIKNDGIVGYVRLWSLLVAVKMPSEAISSNCSMTFTLYGDYDQSTVISTWEYTATEMTSWNTNFVEELRLRIVPRQQRVSSWKLLCEISGSLAHSGIIPISVRQEYGFDPQGNRRQKSSRRVAAQVPSVTVTSP